MERGEEREIGVADAALLRPAPSRCDRGVALRELAAREHLRGHRLRRLSLADALAKGAVSPRGCRDVKVADTGSGVRGLDASSAGDDEALHLDDGLLKAGRPRVVAVG